MKSLKRRGDYRGYSSRGIFTSNRFRYRYSTWHFLITCALVAAGILMLTWFLSHAKAAGF